MKATLYNEEPQAVEPIDEHRLATADVKPEKVDVPKQGLFIVNYKALLKPTLIALAILAVWAIITIIVSNA